MIQYQIAYLLHDGATANDNVILWRKHTPDKQQSMQHVHQDKIAFLFLTKAGFEKPEIWHGFFENAPANVEYNIYIHPKYPGYFNNTLYSHWYNRSLSTHLLIKNTERMQFSLVEASNILFKTAMDDDKRNKKFILLSESHIPLFSINSVYQRLIHDNLSYIPLINEHERPDPERRRRYNIIRNNYFNRTYSQNISEFRKDFVSFKHFIPSAQWIVLDRYLLENYLFKYETHWNTFYSDTNGAIPDENYYSTLFEKYMTKDEKQMYISTTQLTFAQFTYGNTKGDPTMFKKVKNKCIDTLRQRDYLFLRKIQKKTIVNMSYLIQNL